ncbi:hypothetical protein ACQ4PT_012117 [Festuca glaucescens]
MALRKAEEAAARRCEAARWLRQMAPAAVEALPERPSEEEFGAALRNGLILCKVLNRVNPGTVTKVVENPIDAVQSSDGAAQSAIQYFENMRNFLVAVCEMNLLTFEASDIEKGGSSMKVVDCILCLKAYHEWKLSGGIGIWRYGAIVKIAPSSKRLPSHSSRFGGSADQNQQMLEFVHLLSEVSLEETRVKETQHSLFQQFVLRVVRAFLLEWSEADELPLDDMVLETILEQASKEFTILLVSHRNQVRSLLRKMMKDESGVCSKLELIETISKSLNETTLSLFSPLQLPCDSRKRLDDGGGLEHQQEELEKLKLSFNDMKSQVESTRAKWEEDLTRLESYFEAQNHNAYHKLLEENRKLYNQVQDLKGSIRVYCRVKPFPKTQPDQRSTVDHIGENGEIMIMNPEKQGKDGRKIFSFNKIFGPIVSQCGQAKTLMFVHVNPEADSFGETISTLKFAERVATIELGAARVNKEGAQVKDLKEEIGKLKSALDEKEREAAQLRDVTNSITSDKRNARARSPLTTGLRFKPEARQDSSVDTCTSEIRSSSSGKQRRFRSPLSVRELDDKSPVISRELYFSSRKFKTPSPPVRSSFSSERSGTAKTAEKTESIIECTPTPKVELPAKAPHGGSSTRKTPASILTEQKFRDSEENRNAKPPVRESMTKSRLDSARKEEEQPTSGVKVRSEARVRKNWSDMENEFGSSEPTFHSNRKAKKLLPQPATRQSQSIDLRASVREVEAVTEGKHRRNRPPHAERTNVPLPETRRSVSLPRGKFAPV